MYLTKMGRMTKSNCKGAFEKMDISASPHLRGFTVDWSVGFGDYG